MKMRLKPPVMILILPILVTACSLKTPAELVSEGNYRGAVKQLAWMPEKKRPAAALSAGREAFFQDDYALAADFFARAGADDLRRGALFASGHDWLSALTEFKASGDEGLLVHTGGRAVEYWSEKDDPVRLGEVLLILGRDTEARTAFREAGNRFAALQVWDLAEKAYLRGGEDSLAADAGVRKERMNRLIEKRGEDIYRYLDTRLEELSDERGIAKMIGWLSVIEGEIGGYNTRLALRHAFSELTRELDLFVKANTQPGASDSPEEIAAQNIRLSEFEAMARILTRLLTLYVDTESD